MFSFILLRKVHTCTICAQKPDIKDIAITEKFPTALTNIDFTYTNAHYYYHSSHTELTH